MKIRKKNNYFLLIKIIALGIFIAIPFIAFYLGTIYQSTIDKLPSTNLILKK